MAQFPQAITLEGKYITLQPCSPNDDAQELFNISHGTDHKLSIWQLLPIGPYPDVETFRKFLTTWCNSKDTKERPEHVTFTVVDNKTRAKIGGLTFMAIVPEHARLEIGFVWYGKDYQNTFVNMECNYLLMSYAIEILGYKRVEWKCDHRNGRSKGAALKLGFTFEGTFRKHMIVKNGHNRDSDYLSMTDTDWISSGKKQALQEKLLYNQQDIEKHLKFFSSLMVKKNQDELSNQSRSNRISKL